MANLIRRRLAGKRLLRAILEFDRAADRVRETLVEEGGAAEPFRIAFLQCGVGGAGIKGSALCLRCFLNLPINSDVDA